MNKCSVFSLLASLLMTGCAASGPRFVAAPAPASGKALVYVYRKSSMVGAAMRDRVYVNGNFIGVIRSGDYATCEVPPGTVVFVTTPRASVWVGGVISAVGNLNNLKYEKLRIEAEPGKTYYINVYVDWSTKMKVVDEAIGTLEIRSLKLTPVKE